MVIDQVQYNFQNPDPNGHLSKFKSLRYDPELEQLKVDLIAINIWETHEVQKLYRIAKRGTAIGGQRAVVELRRMIEGYKVAHAESDDPFMPYATVEQISINDRGIHICDQVQAEISSR